MWDSQTQPPTSVKSRRRQVSTWEKSLWWWWVRMSSFLTGFTCSFSCLSYSSFKCFSHSLGMFKALFWFPFFSVGDHTLFCIHTFCLFFSFTPLTLPWWTTALKHYSENIFFIPGVYLYLYSFTSSPISAKVLGWRRRGERWHSLTLLRILSGIHSSQLYVEKRKRRFNAIHCNPR